MASWETAMKVDPVGYASFGFYSETFGAGEEGNTANLFSSTGLIDDAPKGGLLTLIHRFLDGMSRVGYA